MKDANVTVTINAPDADVSIGDAGQLYHVHAPGEIIGNRYRTFRASGKAITLSAAARPLAPFQGISEAQLGKACLGENEKRKAGIIQGQGQN